MVELKPSLSLVSQDDLSLQISISLPVPVTCVNSSLITLSHGQLQNFHAVSNTTFLFHLAADHYGSIHVMVEEGAFMDANGEKSTKSSQLSLKATPKVVNCQFVGTKRQFSQYGIEVRVVCDVHMEVEKSSLVVKNATITNIVATSKYNMNVLHLESQEAFTVITIDLSDGFKSKNNIECVPLSVEVSKARQSSFSTSSSYTHSLAYSLPNNQSLCSFNATNLLFSSTILYLVTLHCQNPVYSIYPKFLTPGNDHEVFLYEKWNSGFSLFIVTVYKANILLEIPAGSLFDNHTQTAVPDLPMLQLNTISTGPVPILSLDQTNGCIVEVHFNKPMKPSEISSEALLTVFAEGVAVTKDIESWSGSWVRISLTISHPEGRVWVYVEAGAAHTTGGVPCRGSTTMEVSTPSALFRLTSTIDELEETYTNPVCGRLQAPALLQDIQQNDIVSEGCWIERFVKGSIGGMSVVDFCMRVEREGPFSFGILKEQVVLMNGTKNEEWEISMVWKQGK